MLEDAVKSTCSHILMSMTQAQEHKSLKSVVVWCEREGDLDSWDSQWMVLTPSEEIRQKAISKGFVAYI